MTVQAKVRRNVFSMLLLQNIENLIPFRIYLSSVDCAFIKYLDIFTPTNDK